MRLWIVIGALFALLAVALGAFGAHSLKNRLTIEDLSIFEIGVRYQMYHGLAMILLGLIAFNYNQQMVHWPAVLFIIGIVIFSGTLYLLSITGARWLGAITPIGGTFLIAGWITLIYNLINA